MSSLWYDSDGDSWERDCSYCCNRYEKTGGLTGRQLDYCKVKSKNEFMAMLSKGQGNGCPDFRTEEWCE